MAQAAAPFPQPLLPDYEDRCLSRLVPALMAVPAARPVWLPEAARSAEQLVLLVVDGLGWNQLQERGDLAPTLSGMAGGPITSVVPTTTATALTSITLGCPPSQHGVLGYRMRVRGPTGDEVLNVLRWRTISGDARGFLPPAELQPLRAFSGQPVPVVSKGEFEGSGFSEAHLSGARLVSWAVASSIAVEVRRLLQAGERLVYAYYDGIDRVAHARGFGPNYDAELVAADRLVADLASTLLPGSALVVTSDHGQVDVGRRAVPLPDGVLEETAMVSGEGRFRWLHAKPGCTERLLGAAVAQCGGGSWVVSLDEVDDAGWFGGRLSPTVRERLGDVAVVPHEPIAYLEAGDAGEARLVCRHGSLTADEMLVPLLVVAR